MKTDCMRGSLFETQHSTEDRPCWFNRVLTDSHTDTHLLRFAGHVCMKADGSSCLVFRWLHWCRRRQRWVVAVSPVCQCVWPCYSAEALPLPDPGCVHAYFHSWYIRPQMAVKWSWSFQRWPRLLLQPDSSCLSASSLKCLMTAWFLFCLWEKRGCKILHLLVFEREVARLDLLLLRHSWLIV